MKYKIVSLAHIDRTKRDWVNVNIKSKISINSTGNGGKDLVLPDSAKHKASFDIPVHLWTGVIEPGQTTNNMLVKINDEIYSPVYLMAQLKTINNGALISGSTYNVLLQISFPAWLQEYVELKLKTKFMIMLGKPYDNNYWAIGEILEILSTNNK